MDPTPAPHPSDTARSAWTRMIGALVLLKVVLPLAMLAVLALGVWQIVAGVNAAIDGARAAIAPRIAEAQARIDEIRAEGRRLMTEVQKVKNTTTEIAGAVKESVEPIRKALLGLSGAMRALSGAVESILNAVISVVNAIPFVPDIRRVNLPDFDIPGFRLPRIDIDVDLTPDLAAVQRLNALAQEIASQAQAAIDEIVRIVAFWWWTAKVVGAMIVLWLALALVGYAARAARRLAAGWAMLRGQSVAGGLALL